LGREIQPVIDVTDADAPSEQHLDHAIIEEAAHSIVPSLDHVLRNAAQVEPWLSGHRSNVGAGAVWLQPS